ncbi:hypothetical protein P0L94_09950 [Microbacter sp. GSS18]|nr:hypothetical protein P0L94_09950 [Microbacter sp. GSS18]
MTGGVGAGRPATPDRHRLDEQAPAPEAAAPDAATTAPDAAVAPEAAGDASVPSPPDGAEPGAAAHAAALSAGVPLPASASMFAVGPASADVDSGADSSRLPGQHRGGFSRLPTGPVDVTVRSGPEPDTEVAWAPAPETAPQRGIAAWALAFSLMGLAVSMFVGWGFPIGLVGVVSGALALRRPTENRALAGWAVVLGTASLIYSAGWLWFAASQANLLG